MVWLVLLAIFIILFFFSPAIAVVGMSILGLIFALVMTKNRWWKDLFKNNTDDNPDVKLGKGCIQMLIVTAIAVVVLAAILFGAYRFLV